MRRILQQHLMKVLFAALMLTGISSWGQMTFTSSSLTQTQNFNGLPTGTSTPGNINSAAIGQNWYRSSGTTQSQALSGVVVTGTNVSSQSNAVLNCASSSGSTDRALGVVAASGTTHRIGVQLVNNTGATITQFAISGNVEKYRNGSSNAVTERVAFSYSLNATSTYDTGATWTTVTALDLVEPSNTNTDATTGLDGNLTANKAAFSGSISSLTLANNGTIWIRWADSDDTGNDAILALDDLSITATTAAVTTPSLAITGTTTHGSVCPGTAAAAIQYTITNSGPVAADGVTVVSSDLQFVVSGLSSNTIGANGGTATYYVTFTPSSSGAKTATITVASTTTGSNSPTSSLTGTGTTAVSQAVTSSGATSITPTSAVLNGNLTTLGICPATQEKGFVYSVTSINANPQVGGTGVTKTTVSGVATGVYTLTPTFSPSTGYTFNSYAYDGTTYTYGTARTFTTLAPTATLAGSLNEGTLNSATFTITLNGDTFVPSGSFTGSGFTLNNAPTGVSIASVTRISDTQATVTLSYNDTDFDTSVTTVTVGIPASHLTANAAITSGTITMTAVTEAFTSSGSVTFGNVCINAVANSSFTLTGTVKAGNINIAAVNGYTYSTTSGGTYMSTLSFSQSGGALSQTIYVRFSPTAVQSYPGPIVVSGGAASNFNKTLSGAGVNTLPGMTNTPTSGTLTTTTALLGGNISTAGCSPIVERGIYYSTTNGFADGAGIKVSETGTFSTGPFSLPVSGLSSGTTYYFKSFASNGTSSSYSSQGSFTTVCDAFSLPFTQTFDVATFPPTCWRTYEGIDGLGASVDWARVTSTEAYSGAGAAFMDYDSSGDTQDWLVTPALVIPNNGNEVKLKFFQSQDFASNYGNVYSIRVSTTSQTSHASFTTIETYDETTFGLTYTQKVVDLSDYAGQTIFVAFVMEQNDGDTWYIDSISIKEQVSAPIATEATPLETQGTGFVANWYPVTGATGYKLDVATSTNFEETVISENFAGFATENGSTVINNLNSYTQTPGWTGAYVYEDGGMVKMASGSNYGVLTTPTIDLSRNGGKATLTFDLGQYGTDASRVKVSHAPDGVTFAQVGSFLTPAGFQNISLNITGGTAASKIKIESVAPASGTDKRYYIDNFKVTYSTALTGYSDLSVSGTSKSVPGLTAATTYYYRVRAVDATDTSDNSNVITTVSKVTNVWNGTAWTAGTPPSNIDKAIIEGDYNTSDDGEIVAGYLAINSGTFTIISGDNVSITNGVTINNSLDSEGNIVGPQMIIENNANLIQVNDAANTGYVTVEKESAPLFRLDYALWSSPVSGETLKGFSPNTVDTRFYHYNPVNDAYASVPGTTEFAKGESYLIRVDNTHPDYDAATNYIGTPWAGTYIGTPNNGNVTVDAQAGYNAVGNPYPSPINIAAFYSANSSNLGADAALYFWRKKNGSAYSSYASLTLAGYTANGQVITTPTGDVNYGDASNGQFSNASQSNTWVLNPGQGFIVQSNGNDIVFNNAMRRPVNNGQLFDVPAIAPSRLWVDMSDATGSFHQAMISYTENGTMGIDYGLDGRAFTDGSIAIYSIVEDTKLGIQARPSFDDTDVVAMGYKAASAGSYTISLHNAEGVFVQGQNIFLRDNLLGTTHDLTAGNYQFTTEAGTFAGRFDIIYAQPLGTEQPAADTNNVIAYKNGNAISISSGAANMTGVTVYDTRGRMLYNATGINATETTVSGLQAQQQVLIVKVATDRGTVTKKIIF